MELERVSTGIPGLNEILGGGLIAKRPYLVAGGPGAGKTILCMHFLLEGLKNNEKGLYISLEESASQLRQDMSVFGWDISRLRIMDTMQELGTEKWVLKTDKAVSRPEFTVINLVRVIEEKLRTYRPKRLVIDSITSVRMLYDKEFNVRRELLTLMNFLAKSACTTLLTSESYMHNSEVQMEEFLASGVIKLHKIESKGERISAISVEKFRGSGFDRATRPMKITNEGITVFPGESIFESSQF